MIASWMRDRVFLEREVCRPAYAPVLAALQERVPEVAHLTSWPAVAQFVQARGVREQGCDCVLRPLIQIHAAGVDNKASTVLLLLCLSELTRLHRARRYWMPGQGKRWRHTRFCFLRVLHRLDPAQRPQRLGQKLLNDTARSFYDECAREWAQNARFVTVDPNDLDATIGVEDPAFEDCDRRLTSDKAARRVRSAVAAGSICLRDSFLLLGTRIYGLRLRGAADQLGIGYEAAKKRRQRAEAALRRKKS